MDVAVGSANPVKVRATERVLESTDATVAGIDVDSGVSEQPVSEAETIRGARIRAERALGAGDYDVGVGIEGGVASVDGQRDRFLTMWAVVTDGDRVGRGAGPRLALPVVVARRIEDGEELGPVMDDLLGTANIATREGAAGALTGGRITRESSLAHAVAGAFGPFLTDQYTAD